MKRPIVALDLDEVVIEGFVSSLLMEYNNEYEDTLSIDDITDYRIDQFLKPACEHFFKEFATKRFFKTLEITDDTIQAIEELESMFDVIYLTAAHPTTIRARDKLLNLYIPSYHSRQLVVCRDKSLLDGNIFALVDDCADNVKKMKCVTVLKTMPWNQQETGCERAANLTEAVRIIYDEYTNYKQGKR